ncbi:hypothetical protein ScPMuIL_002324, partial [Solemya velum]
ESLGHGSLMRYYKQNIAPNRRENSGIPPKMLAQCKALGWTGATGVTGTQFTHAVLQTKHCSKSKKKFWDSSKNVSTMQSSWVDWRNRSHWDTVHSCGITDKTSFQIEEKILGFLQKC